MTSYPIIAKVGSNRELSKLELSLCLEKLNISDIKWYEWKEFIFLYLKPSYIHKFKRLLSQTGSIVKVYDVIYTVDNLTDKNLEKKFSTNVIPLIIKNLSKKRGKFQTYKISLNIRGSKSEKQKLSKVTRKALKNMAFEQDIPLKILPAKKVAMEFSPYQYYKENIPNRGLELNWFVIKSKLYLAITSWVTNPLIDIKLDENRPKRLFTHGTSIKLARTLVFLANLSKHELLLDPFCGSGTILQTALLQNLSVIGVDNDSKSINASKANIEYFMQNKVAGKKIEQLSWEIYKQDSRYLNRVVKKKIDALVTEPFLGPFLKSLPSLEKGKRTMKNLEDLYIQTLNSSYKLLKNGARVVFIFPVYQYDSNVNLQPDMKFIAKKTSLKLLTEIKPFNIKFPISIGRSHNILMRNLAIFVKTE